MAYSKVLLIAFCSLFFLSNASMADQGFCTFDYPPSYEESNCLDGDTALYRYGEPEEEPFGANVGFFTAYVCDLTKPIIRGVDKFVGGEDHYVICTYIKKVWRDL